MGVIRDEMRVIKERDPAIKTTIEVFLYPSLYAILFHRMAHWFYKHKRYFIARLISQLSRFFTGIEIHPGATIGSGLFIDHGMGVVIGETAELGDNVTIYQGATLGGTGKDTGKRHPTIGNNVVVGAGAKVLGPFRVGNNAKVAAGAVVLREVPDNCTVVGVPGRIVERDKRDQGCASISEMLDQVKIPDPIARQFCILCTKIDKLEMEVERLELELQHTRNTSSKTEQSLGGKEDENI